MSEGPSIEDLRAAVLQRLHTFTVGIEWVGESADRAFADSIIANMRWYAVLWLRQVADDIEADVPTYTATALRKQADQLEGVS